MSDRAMQPKAHALPPAANEAERGILGCILLDPGLVIPKLIDAKVSAGKFLEKQNRELFCLLLDMHREGIGIDTPTVKPRMAESKWLDKLNADVLLEELRQTTPSALNWSYYLPDLETAFFYRAAWAAANRVMEFCEGREGDPQQLQADFESTLRGLCDTASPSLPTIIDASQLLAEPQSEPAEIVCGLLHQGSKMVIGGGSKSFKTWSLIDLALSVSHGEPWISFKTNRGRVLYLNFEIQQAFFKRRIVAVARAKGIEVFPSRLDVWNLRGHGAEFSLLLPKIRDRVKELGYVLIVLDPIYKLYGNADENKAGDIAKLLNQIEDLAVSTGAAVAFGAHFSKGNQAGKDSIDRISGSGVFARDPDSILIFTKHTQENAFAVEATLRNFKPVEPFVIQWDFPLMRRDGTLDPAKLKQAGTSQSQYSTEQLLEALGEGKMRSVEWCENAMDDFGMSRSTFYELLGQLAKAKTVMKNKQRQWIIQKKSDGKSELD